VIRIGLIGDRDDSVVAHQAIPRALALVAASLGVEIEPVWLATSTLAKRFKRDVPACDGLWCVPASPYADAKAAIRAIRFAREHARPFLGTCGGFQHAMLEYAESVLGVENPAHAEMSPGASDPVISALSCALVEATGAVRFAPDSRLARAYGDERAVEGYHCSYGLSASYTRRLVDGPLRATCWDDAGDVRGVELAGHPFFVATLFQPERAALREIAPPIVRAFVEAAGTAR
jgi:CTP synthase (UTP-ammonia lyase)